MEVDREIEMMLCMNHQDYAVCLDGKTISFSLECMIDMWDILKEATYEPTLPERTHDALNVKEVVDVN